MTRSRSLALVGALLVLSNVGHSQDMSQDRPLTAGIIAGVNRARIVGDDVENANSRFGGAAGVYLARRINNVLALRLEALFSQKGVSIQESETIQDVGTIAVESKIALSYLEVPLLAHLSFPSTNRMSTVLQFGPSIAFKLRCRFDFKIETDVVIDGLDIPPSQSSSCEEAGDPDTDPLPKISSTDFGFVAGGGFDFGRFAALLRYTHGLKALTSEDDEKVYNRVLALIVSIRLSRAR